MRILQLLDVSDNSNDMNIAGFHFHSLQRKPKRWSVRVTGNYRVTFGWTAERAVILILRTITKDEAMQKKSALPPIHPGELIKEDILPSVGLSVTAAAKALGVSRQMLHEILAARRPLSAVMCLKVARLFAVRRSVDAAPGSVRFEESGANKKLMLRVARIVPVAALETNLRNEIRDKPPSFCFLWRKLS